MFTHQNREAKDPHSRNPPKRSRIPATLSKTHAVPDVPDARLPGLPAADPWKQCPRCSGRKPSLIFYPPPQPPWGMPLAGISDRQWIFKVLLAYARLFCAELLVQPPCRMLDPQHNAGRKLSCNACWTRSTTP